MPILVSSAKLGPLLVDIFCARTRVLALSTTATKLRRRLFVLRSGAKGTVLADYVH
jgi:hypothetical protein